MKIKIHKVEVNFVHLDQGKVSMPTNASIRITYQLDGIIKVIDKGISIPSLREDIIRRILLAAILQHEEEEKERKILEQIIRGIEGQEYTEEDIKQ